MVSHHLSIDLIESNRQSLDREPAVEELLMLVPLHGLTLEERRAQAESEVRSMRPTGDPPTN